MSTVRMLSASRHLVPRDQWRGLRCVIGLALIGTIALGCKDRPADKDDDDDDVPQAATPRTDSASAPATDPAPGPAALGSAAQAPMTWTFDSAAVGQPPPGFSFGRTGSGPLGRWVVRAASDAPSGANVLAQEDSDPTDYRFPVAVATAPSLSDLTLSVRCKPVAGKVDRACGVVWRYQDADNYYLARANALEDNVRLYYVKDGRRRQFAGWNGKVTSGVWHTLRVEAVGDHQVVSWDGTKVIDGHDRTFSAAGRIGVWTKADSQTLFDDLSVTPLTP